MKEIESRKDIRHLIECFYSTVRKDDMLGPIFNAHISEKKWPAHLDTLTDFWETNLFGTKSFQGSPSQKHLKVDQSLNYGMNQNHFGRWIQLWLETLDEHFVGDIARKAKDMARRMATGQFILIWNNRPENREGKIPIL